VVCHNMLIPPPFRLYKFVMRHHTYIMCDAATDAYTHIMCDAATDAYTHIMCDAPTDAYTHILLYNNVLSLIASRQRRTNLSYRFEFSSTSLEIW